MTGGFTELWVYLAADPLSHLTLTLVAYLGALRLYERAGRAPWLNPVLIAVAVISLALVALETPYQTYFDGAQFVHFLLGPATVALAVPLYRQVARLRRAAGAIAVSLVAGSATAVVTALGVVHLFGAGEAVLASIAPKSVTAPVAMGIAEQLGGLPSLTAVLVILTGILGAIVGPPLLDAVRVRSAAARGLALGTASHGIGTARAFQDGEIAGAFAGIAMGLNALATAALLPMLWLWWRG